MTHRLKWWTSALAGVALIALAAHPALAADKEAKEAPARVTRIDFENSEPYQVRAKVMEVKPAQGTFIVAEREICELDLVTGTGHLHTTHYNLAGNPVEAHAYRVGQYLLVKGYLLPEGNVAATEVRMIEKPQGAPAKYKPIAAQGKGKRGSRTSAGGP
jgi:hypothetical protein